MIFWIKRSIQNLDINALTEFGKYDLWKFLLDLQYSRINIIIKNKNKKEARIFKNRLYKLMWNNSRKLIYNIDKLWYNKSIIIKPRNELILELLISVKENKFVLQIISECENIEDNEEDVKDLDIEDNILEDQNEIDEYIDEFEQ